jgi:hypothetical protein
LSVTVTVAAFKPVVAGRKVTLIVQLAPAVRLEPQVVVREKSTALVPVIATLLIVIVALPVFLSVATTAALLVLIVRMPNGIDVGERLATGLIPVPLKVTRWGLPLALSVTERVADRADAAVGLNVTVIEQLVPAARLLPQLLVAAKSPELLPESAILVIVSAPAPVLESVTVWGLLAVLSAWFPNAKEVGLNEASGIAVLVKLTPVTLAPFTVTARLVGVKL